MAHITLLGGGGRLGTTEAIFKLSFAVPTNLNGKKVYVTNKICVFWKPS